MPRQQLLRERVVLCDAKCVAELLDGDQPQAGGVGAQARQVVGNGIEAVAAGDVVEGASGDVLAYLDAVAISQERIGQVDLLQE